VKAAGLEISDPTPRSSSREATPIRATRAGEEVY
jgi:hypothetical protein